MADIKNISKFTHFEKPPTSSRKFVGFILADIGWSILLGYGIAHSGDNALFSNSVLFTMVLVKGFLETVYIGSQAAVDKFVRVAEIAAAHKQGSSIPETVLSTEPTVTIEPDPEKDKDTQP